jgi:hypothetical protein
MAAKYNPKTDTYLCEEEEERRELGENFDPNIPRLDILEEFDVKFDTAEEIAKMLATRE